MRRATSDTADVLPWCSLAVCAGNFPTVTRVLLAKIPPLDGKMSYVYDKHVFHYLVEGNITYLCMADEGMKRRIPFTFLEDVKRRFVTQVCPRVLRATAKALRFCLEG